MAQPPFNLGTDPRGVFKGQGLSGPGGFEDVLGNRAQEVEQRQGMGNIFDMSPEQLQKYAEPIEGFLGVGALKNITGKSMPEVLLRGVKTNPQDKKLAANWFDEVFRDTQNAPKNKMLKDYMSLPTAKISKLNDKLAKHRLKLSPTPPPRGDPRVLKKLEELRGGLLPEGIPSETSNYGSLTLFGQGTGGQWMPIAHIKHNIGRMTGKRGFYVQDFFRDLNPYFKKGSKYFKGGLMPDNLESVIDMLIESVR